MSKTLSDITKLIGSKNDQLFDRFINFRLSESETQSKTDLCFNTPAFGQKPNISLSGTLNAEDAVHTITLTVSNISENIDYNQYGYIEIEVGYLSSGVSTKFKGVITNCYMAKPNPNGELVIGCTLAKVSEFFGQGNFTVTFKDTQVSTIKLIQTCIDTINNALGTKFRLNTDNLPVAWLPQSFNVNHSSYQFRSPLDCVTWLNSMLMAHSMGYAQVYGGNIPKTNYGATSELPPIMVTVSSEDSNVIRVAGIYENGNIPVVKALSNIGSAYIIGNSYGKVTAPFVPDIKPGDFIYIDSKYFKTRVNLTIDETFKKFKKSIGSVWAVINIEFTFSTFNANNMILQLQNVNNNVNYSGQ